MKCFFLDCNAHYDPFKNEPIGNEYDGEIGIEAILESSSESSQEFTDSTVTENNTNLTNELFTVAVNEELPHESEAENNFVENAEYDAPEPERAYNEKLAAIKFALGILFSGITCGCIVSFFAIYAKYWLARQKR